MPIDKIAFLQFAQSLSDDSEIQMRNSVSRAYYAAYHTCLDVYKTDGTAEGGVHAKLISGLKNSPNINDRKVGFMLQQLKMLRTTADYHLTSTVSIKDKQTAIGQTERLIDILSTNP
ncbi:hypothetical protein CWO84_02875 [Methylomonas sp. Kb3]|uniref:hypothetical protein n=1 Tax=Methylomonas sp. Kb3 TaxID=1611544 RepID=UPI000C33296A|nr:hypothetical protein [Methylomonas sp. Kb3]PKD41985.1 hypothetical protein CWO84_02875 [Methylomonas sp. Kb3]